MNGAPGKGKAARDEGVIYRPKLRAAQAGAALYRTIRRIDTQDAPPPARTSTLPGPARLTTPSRAFSQCRFGLHAA
jgi:hypothetical protein